MKQAEAGKGDRNRSIGSQYRKRFDQVEMKDRRVNRSYKVRINGREIKE